MKKIALKTLFAVLVFFGMTYMLLVFSNRWGKLPYFVAGLGLVSVGAGLALYADRLKSDVFKSNILAILSSISLWGFVGEFLENADLYVNHASIEIAHPNYLPILLLAIITFVYLMKKKYLPVFLLFLYGSFLGIWTLHYIMISEMELFSSVSPVAYSTFGTFLVAAVFCAYRMIKSDGINQSMAYTLATLYLGWSLLEFIWVWRLIPGPYSI